jgi:hypothetical protein
MLQTIKISKHNQTASSSGKSKLHIASDYEKGKTPVQKAAEWLKAKYGVEFDQKALPFGTRIDGTVAYHKFDLVSPDKQIVAEVKAHIITASGNVPSAKILDTYVACGRLERVSAKTKMLILSDFGFYRSFRNNSYGRIPRQIEIVCIADEQQPVLACV